MPPSFAPHNINNIVLDTLDLSSFGKSISDQDDDLTEEELRVIEEIKTKYLNMFFNLTIKYNEKNIIEGIKWLYKISNLDEPEVIIVDSPKAALKKANELYNENPNEKQYFPFSIYGNIYNMDLLIELEFYERINQIEYNEHYIHMVKFRKLITSGIWDSIQLDDCCIVSKMPIAMYKNDKYQLHNESGPAIKWKDGYEIYVWNGININKDIILDPLNVTNINNLNLSEQKILQTRIGRRLFFKKFGFSVPDN
jgi:hypothetical protein